jgi:hypothetical protein
MYAADEGIAGIVTLGKGQELSYVDQAHVGIGVEDSARNGGRLLRLHFRLIVYLFRITEYTSKA